MKKRKEQGRAALAAAGTAILVVLVLLAGCSSGPDQTGRGAASATRHSPPGVAVAGTVTVVDAGSLHCKPCLMMMPILDRLEKDYQGRAAVKFIDVNKDPDTARALGVVTIPTQILYDRDGNEILRHIGFFPEEELRGALDKVLAGRAD